jgi:hypothetical protein
MSGPARNEQLTISLKQANRHLSYVELGRNALIVSNSEPDTR